MDRRGDPSGRRLTNRVAEYGLIAAMFVVSLAFWIVTPFVALWLTSKLSDDGLVVVFAGAGIVCPVLMAGFGLVLGRLNGAYVRAVGADPARRIPAWRASLSGERVKARRPRAVLEVSLTLAVLVAGVLLLVFFVFFAHNANPGQVGL